ncbi:MAG: nucleotidyltransferase family protein [Actinobacteria bacterium]|nr:nucleotidyltransferase family protein [Actinomycetota bacterium]MCG2819515.1 nucleotidyltransferase family protein [Actinomycetes bacterium]MBU4218487.1 nucleotidyltransferase family protein [Actinomycetota bacterium]MBU4360138.1 nucleotidyltransferase family protein [Actinomycetota bacterium]MBU4401757.1 nucleotidyltransferase family protein [Actinomycetota bacterium]
MTAKELLEAKRDEILRIAGRHGANNIRVFGSVARGDDGPGSDVDLLVDFEPGRSLLDQAALLLELEELLGREVDVLTEQGMHQRVRGRALEEAVPL